MDRKPATDPSAYREMMSPMWRKLAEPMISPMVTGSVSCSAARLLNYSHSVDVDRRHGHGSLHCYFSVMAVVFIVSTLEY